MVFLLIGRGRINELVQLPVKMLRHALADGQQHDPVHLGRRVWPVDVNSFCRPCSCLHG